MWKLLVLTLVIISTSTHGEDSRNFSPRSGDELVGTVLDNCVDMDCVKLNVLGYLDNVLKIKNAKNIDAAIFKRAARVLKTSEFRFKVPEVLLEKTEIVYSPRYGLDVISEESTEESRALGLKKKLLLPFLLLFKLKLKLLMPIFVALIGLKATKALILSKLAILIVLGFVVYQLMGKAGMSMPMSMGPAPAEPPTNLYGAPAPPPTMGPDSYAPGGWDPHQGGPYQRVWSGNQEAQNLAYSSYYPGTSASSTSHP